MFGFIYVFYKRHSIVCTVDFCSVEEQQYRMVDSLLRECYDTGGSLPSPCVDGETSQGVAMRPWLLLLGVVW